MHYFGQINTGTISLQTFSGTSFKKKDQCPDTDRLLTSNWENYPELWNIIRVNAKPIFSFFFLFFFGGCICLIIAGYTYSTTPPLLGN